MAEENFEEQNMDGVHEENFDEQNVGVVPEENFDEQNLDSVPRENFDGQNVGGENSQPPEAVKKTEHDTKADDIKKWPGWPGENVFRMLIPVQKVGGIIGRKGEFIKRMCQETKARIKILEGPQGATERAVMVSAKEEPDLPIPPAMEGLLRVHKLLIDGDIESSQMLSSSGETIVTRLLLAATQAGSLIGKQGATIKSIQDASHCIVRVLGGETLPPFALPDDSVVEIQGEPAGVHQAVELIATHLRKFLVDRSIIGVFESQMQMSNTRVNQNMPPPPPWGPVGPVPPNFPMNAGGGPGFMPNPHHMPPPRQFDDFYPPPDMAPLDKQPHHGPPAYGKDPSLGPLASNVQTQQSMVMKVTQNMQIPISYADAVIGTSGANISYIRRASGATIAVQETRGVPGEMTVEINGSASQVQTAQQLIQNFIAEAASATQNPSEGGGGPPQGQQGYNAYNPYGPVYASPQPNSAAQPGGAGGGYAPPPPPPGDYASVYGANYGY